MTFLTKFSPLNLTTPQRLLTWETPHRKYRAVAQRTISILLNAKQTRSKSLRLSNNPVTSPTWKSIITVQTTGDLTLTFKRYKELTVPAGTYKMFEVDLTSNNLAMTINTPSPSLKNLNVTAPVEASNTTMNTNLLPILFEYNTMHQIHSTMRNSNFPINNHELYNDN